MVTIILTSQQVKDVKCLLSKGLNLLHLYSRGILPKLDDLRVLAANAKVAVIGTTESRLATIVDSEIEITHCTIFRRDINRDGMYYKQRTAPWMTGDLLYLNHE